MLSQNWFLKDQGQNFIAFFMHLLLQKKAKSLWMKNTAAMILRMQKSFVRSIMQKDWQRMFCILQNDLKDPFVTPVFTQQALSLRLKILLNSFLFSHLRIQIFALRKLKEALLKIAAF